MVFIMHAVWTTSDTFLLVFQFISVFVARIVSLSFPPGAVDFDD